jgi:hypothetical protein
MRPILMQPWITISGTAPSVVSVAQDAELWVDLSDFADATFWIDVRAFSAGLGSGAFMIILESSPTADETFFTPVTGLTPIVAASTTPIAIKSVIAQSSTGISRFVRWRISNVGATSGTWSVTFRIRAVPSRAPFFVPTQISGCVLWLRSDLGLTLSGQSVSGWADQSGKGNNASQAGAAEPTLSISSYGFPKLTTTAAQYMSGAFSSPPSNFTLYAVVVFPSPIANSGAFASTDASGTEDSGASLLTDSGGGEIFAAQGTTGGAVGNLALVTTSNLASLGSVGIYSTAANATSVDLWINGQSIGTAAVL